MFPSNRRSNRSALIAGVSACISVGLLLAGSTPASADGGKGKGQSKKVVTTRSNSNNSNNSNNANTGNNASANNARGHDDFDDRYDDDRDDARRTTSCRGDWAAVSSARPPALRTNGVAGIYVWHNGRQWNVYATHTGRNLVTFQGFVRFDSATDGKGKSLERNSDSLTHSGNGADFTFRNYGDLDGIRFTSSCATTITVSALINGQPAPVFVGRNAVPVSGTYSERRTTGSPVVTTPTVPAPTAPPATVPVGLCGGAAWNPGFYGVPVNLQRGGAAGLYVWLDGDRIRIETTRPNNGGSVIAGVVSVNSTVSAVRAIDIDGGADTITPAINGATFSFYNTGGIDGLELQSPCATQIVISATIDGQPVTVQQLFVGRAGFNPGAAPLVLMR